MRSILLLSLVSLLLPAVAATQPQAIRSPGAHTFTLGASDFLLDGAPLQIISCEMHPARIPAEYWAHRIRMAKAMGCNTIAAYVFWNYHEPEEGKFDFTTGNRDVARFVKIAHEERLWVLLRPGPYVCAEWDFGGIPPYLLKDPELRVRSLYPRYMQAAERFQARLARAVKPLLVTRGGPILMVQIENEYGSYGNDRKYMARLRDVWTAQGIDVPFFTSDGPTPHMLEAGSLPGAAVGLDPGSNEQHWELARSVRPGVPVFSSETYPGWLTHWGEPWAAPSLPDLLKEVTFLLTNRKSFNFYVAHGGTNFGFTAGANSGGKGYEPDVTSYDYDAPINEQGGATPKYHALRELIASYLPAGSTLPPVPEPIPSITVPEFAMVPYVSLWDRLTARPAQFFRGTFRLERPADTFLDMTGYRKGVVWVNGHNLGRYWDIGPQKRLYCPATWLKAGENEVVVFDLQQTSPMPLHGTPTS